MKPAGRIAADPLSILEYAAAVCGLGAVRSWAPITTGFEDVNVDLVTDEERVVVKIFAGWRDTHAPARTAALIEAAIDAGVRHPRVLPDRAGDIVHHHPGTGVPFLVLERVDARDHYNPARAPTTSELADVIAQASLFHRLDLDPTPHRWPIPGPSPTSPRCSTPSPRT